LSIITKLEDINGKKAVQHFATGLLLSIAYSASIGGVATLVGTPPNLSFARIFYIYFPNAPEISFASWFMYAFPITVILFIILFLYLYFVFVGRKRKWTSISATEIKTAHKDLGEKTYEEKILLIAFVSLAFLWFFRVDIAAGSLTIPGWSRIFKHPEFFNDGTVGIFVAIILFMIPSKTNPGTFLMDWKAAEDIPWEIILLFGGGFALASGFKESGLSTWFGEQLGWLNSVHPILLILCICFLITFLTEVTSNTATVETMLPILAGLSVSIETNPLLFMLPATVAGSLAFMLPVATPPNAIVFGSKRISMIQMAKTGFALNIIGILIVTLVSYYLGSYIFDITHNVFPDWAR
ncbi:MAG: SLC13 family permease, partial [Saprospiraceae bacterium]|nr:SLC13 family permease [Saprospiraceae bacterium]